MKFANDLMPGEMNHSNAMLHNSACLPVILMPDISGSMRGEPMQKLEEAMRTFREDVMRIPEARARIDIAVIAYDSSPHLVTEFTDIDHWEPPTLTAGGLTETAEAMQFALDYMDEYRRTLNEAGIPMYRPIIVHISDGASTSSEDDTQQALARIHARMRATGGTNKLKLWNFSTCDDEECLRALKQYSPFTIKVENRCYADVFNWLADSFAIISSSTLVMSKNGEYVEEQQVPPPLPQNLTFVEEFNR